MEFSLKNKFICDYCRNICPSDCNGIKLKIQSGEYPVGSEEYEKNKDLSGNRKQIIRCLGKFCPYPCKYNDPEAYKEISYETLFDAIIYLGQKCNDLLEEREKK